MYKSERRKKLDQTIKDFNKVHKSQVFSKGSEIEDLPVIPSGIKKIDDFIGGGFKNGGHTIIWGTYSVGKTALVLTAIANAQKLGKLVCYVNTEKPIEPERFKFFGVNLDDMLYIEAPENAEKALEAMRTLCKNKVIDLFIIDSTNGLCPKSVQEEKTGKERSLEKKNIASLPLILSNFYNIVSAHIFRSRASIIWIGQARTQGIGTFFTRLGLSGGNAQEFYAYQIIFMRRGQNADAPMKAVKIYFLDPDGKLHFKTEKVSVGFDVVLKLEKTNSCRSAVEKSELHIPFVFKEGFVDEFDPEGQDIEISGTDEQKEIITAELILKGVISGKVEPTKMTKEVGESLDNVDVEKVEEKITRKVRTGGGKLSNGKTYQEVKDAVKPKKKNGSKIIDMVEYEIENLSKIIDVTEAKKELTKLTEGKTRTHTKESKNTPPPVQPPDGEKKRRGRPKGAKNKDKK